MLRTLIALIAAAMFTGAALSLSLAEPSSRGTLERRTGALQALLAFASLALGLWAWWRTGFGWLLAGAVLIGAAFLVAVLRMRSGRGHPHAAAPVAGGGLHWSRTALGLAAVAAYLMAFVQP